MQTSIVTESKISGYLYVCRNRMEKSGRGYEWAQRNFCVGGYVYFLDYVNGFMVYVYFRT